MKHILLLLVILGGYSINGQTVKIVDSKSGESIPYANIRVNGTTALVSNAEGYFTLPASSGSESTLVVSYLGYETRQIDAASLQSQPTIRLTPAIYNLENINVIKRDPAAIMAMVAKNAERNYRPASSTKDMVFLRNANTFSPSKFDIEITESTGFTKSGLSTANRQLTLLTSSFIKRAPVEFEDLLFNYYTPKAGTPKMQVVKATKLLDQNRSVTLDEVQKNAAKVILKHLDTTKYYRVKSGLIGTRDTVSLRKDFNKKNEKPRSELVSSKSELYKFLAENTFDKNSPLDFVTHPSLYEYQYDGAILSKDHDLVFVLLFKPKKSKAKFTGKLYISEIDYAVVRTDFTLAKGKTLGGFNMKLLLGVKASENLSNGTLIFNRNPIGESHYLQYASVESGQYLYVNRPLKFIELTKAERDVVAFDLKFEGRIINKTEYLNISRDDVSDGAIAEVSESDFKYEKLTRYDPTIWKDYSAIEPLEQMKQFRAEE